MRTKAAKPDVTQPPMPVNPIPLERRWLLDQYMADNGSLTELGKKAMMKKGPGSKLVKKEIILWFWTQFKGADKPEVHVAEATGLSEAVIKKFYKEYEVEMMKAGGAHFILEQEAQLARIRFASAEELIQQFADLATMALRLIPTKILEAGPRDLAAISAMATDKMLLLSGQPTSRVSKMDERVQTDKELKDKLKATRDNFKLIKLEADKAAGK